jgi:acetyl-CoA C-acetyltransferase
MRPVDIVGIGQLPVQKETDWNLRQMGAQVVRLALANAGLHTAGALYLGNMLSDDIQGQKHVAALIADEACLSGIEALQIRAAMASGAAALHTAYLAVASGAVDTAIAAGVEIMGQDGGSSNLAKALDAEREVPYGLNMLTQNALVMRDYLDCQQVPAEALALFAVNAHENARNNPNALFRERQFTVEEALHSRLIAPPIRLLDCSPICDGAAAVVLASADTLRKHRRRVRVLASSVATDRFRLADRADPLALHGAFLSAQRAYQQAGIGPEDVDLFEAHDAFTIMACLSLEAAGFAARGQGWRLAASGDICIGGRIPLSTMGGLKARGHPIGATALYQASEIFLQLNGEAGPNQVPGAGIGLMQSIGGVATTVITHILARNGSRRWF